MAQGVGPESKPQHYRKKKKKAVEQKNIICRRTIVTINNDFSTEIF
jgi:hypothetical protein